jgi:hypothetical protein
MTALLRSFGRGVASQFSLRTMLLILSPLFLAIAVGGALLWLGLQPAIDFIQAYFAGHDGFAISGHWLSTLRLGALKEVIVPLLAVWLFLPLLVVTALLFVGLMAMPALVSHIGKRHHPGLERRRSGNLLSMLWVSVVAFLIFVSLWIVTTPLCASPLVGFAIQPVLWGWLTCRVIAHDVFARYADENERVALLRTHRWQLLAIGTVTGILGVAPSLLWLGGVISLVFFPLFAALSICLYVLVFTFSGLWFTHYGLAALSDHRRDALASIELVDSK